MSDNSILEQLKAEIGNLKIDTSVENVGTISKVGDGVAEIKGLSGVLYSELLEFEGLTEVSAMALNLEEYTTKAIILGDPKLVREGQIVKSTGRVLSIKVSKEMIGRVIDPLGNPKDGGPKISDTNAKAYPLEKIAPGVITRESVKTPLHTGWKSVDTMIPIGRGQRELIIGDRQTGKTAIAIDTIINQGKDKKFKTPICIYVAIGQKESKIAQLVEKLRKTGAMDYTIVISASASESASLQYLAPYAGCAIGEYFMDQGEDALVVYDDLSKHAVAYREVSLLLRRPPGREAYPGDIFYLHSRLLERSAKLSKEFGGGSLTALPIIETQLGDISAYIPTNVISITDGQIYLEPELFYQGIKPAINVGLSVSRVGSSAQTKAMKKVAGTMRLELAQFRELAAFAEFGQDLDKGTKEKLERGKRLTELLKQDENDSVPFEEQVVAVFAITNNFADKVEVSDIKKFEKSLIKFLKDRKPEILNTLRDQMELTDDLITKIKDACGDFAENHYNLDTNTCLSGRQG